MIALDKLWKNILRLSRILTSPIMADESMITMTIKVTNTAVASSVRIKINSGRRSVGCSFENKWWSAKFPNPIPFPPPGSAVCLLSLLRVQERRYHGDVWITRKGIRHNPSKSTWAQPVRPKKYCRSSALDKKWYKNHILKYDWIEHGNGSLKESKMYQKCTNVSILLF